jgi:hypothetical protein
VQQQNRAVQDHQMGDLMRRSIMHPVSTEPHVIVTRAAFFVFAATLERALHAAMWDKVRRLQHPEEARDRAREALLAFLRSTTTQQPTGSGGGDDNIGGIGGGTAEPLLRQVVRFADTAITMSLASSVAGGPPPPPPEEEAKVIRLLDRAVPPPPIPAHALLSSGSSSAEASPDDDDRGTRPSIFGPLPDRLPCVRSLRLVAEGGDGTPLMANLSLTPQSALFDVERPAEMAHDCFLNYLRHALAIIYGHPFFKCACGVFVSVVVVVVVVVMMLMLRRGCGLVAGAPPRRRRCSCWPFRARRR